MLTVEYLTAARALCDTHGLQVRTRALGAASAYIPTRY